MILTATRLMPKRPEMYEVCSECGSLKYTEAARTRSRKGGQATYQKSLQKGEMSMSDRGKLGGRPRRLTLAELLGTDRPNQGGVGAPREVGPQPTELTLPVTVHHGGWIAAGS